MDKPKEYKAMRLELGRISVYLSQIVSAVIGREVRFTAAAEDKEYWSVAAIHDCFSMTELLNLIRFVGGDGSMCRDTLPTESDTSKSLGMILARALLKKAMRTDWEREFITDDAIWIIGCWDSAENPQELKEDLMYIGKTAVRMKDLWPADEFEDRLFQNGGTYSDLVNLCEKYQDQFGEELFWHYSMTDGRYTGVYLVLVQEGVLAISYDEVTEQDHESFVRESVKLCTDEDLNWLMADWRRTSDQLLSAMDAMAFYLERNVRSETEKQ